MSWFRRRPPGVPPRDSVAVLVVNEGHGWQVASGYGDGAVPSWTVRCEDDALEETLAVGLARDWTTPDRDRVDSHRWFAGGSEAPLQPALEDAALAGRRFFTVALGPRGCVVVRYLLRWPLAGSPDRTPLTPGSPPNGTACHLDEHIGWSTGDFATGRYSERLDAAVTWLQTARHDDPRLAAFYHPWSEHPELPLLPVIPEFAKGAVTGLLNDSDSPVDTLGPARHGLTEAGVNGRWRMLLHWDPWRSAPDRDALAGHLGIVVTADEQIRWFHWLAGDPAPQVLGRRGQEVWSMAQRQIAVAMMRALVAAGRIPEDWTRRRLG